MTGNPLVGTYRRYKAGTEKLVKWLWDSSRACQPPAGKKPTSIFTKDLVTFATQIAAFEEPKIDIPLEILDITKDCITGRKLCLAWYAEFANDAKSNDRHKHFVAVLEQVFDILKKEHKARRPKRKKKMPELSTDVNDLSNLYSRLELEDAASEDEQPAQRPAPSSASKKETKKATEPKKKPVPACELEDNKDEEKSFAVWCLFKDLFDIRMHMQNVWKRYNAGELTMLLACKLCREAMNISGIISEEFADKNEDLSTYDKIVEFIGFHWCREEAQFEAADANLRAMVGAAQPKPDIDHQADLLCMPAWSALLDYEQLVLYHEKVTAKKESRVVWELRNRMPLVHDTAHPFAHHLLSIAADCKAVMDEFCNPDHDHKHTRCMEELKRLLRSVDPYSRHLLMLSHHNPVCVSLVFMTQLYMDMYVALGGDWRRPFRETVAAFRWVDGVREENMTFTKEEASDRIVSQLDRKTDKELEKVCIRAETGHSHKGKSVWCLAAGCACWKQCGKVSKIPEIIIAALPILPTTYASSKLSLLQEVGTEHCSFLHCVLATAHVYEAGKLLGVLDADWKDLVCVVKEQNKKHQHTFVREGDGTLKTLAKQYSISLGIDPVQASRGSKPSLPSTKSVFKKALKLKESHSLNDAIRANSHAASYGVDSGEGLSPYYDCIKRLQISGGGIEDSVIRGQWQATKKMTPGQLLTVLAEVFIDEELHHNFDYVAFGNACAELLYAIAQAYIRGEHAKGPVDHRKLDLKGYEVVHHVIWDAAIAEAEGLPKEGTVLYEVGKILNSFIQEKGDKFLRHSWKKSSGHLPEHLKPESRFLTTTRQVPNLETQGILVTSWDDILSICGCTIAELEVQERHLCMVCSKHCSVKDLPANRIKLVEKVNHDLLEEGFPKMVKAVPCGENLRATRLTTHMVQGDNLQKFLERWGQEDGRRKIAAYLMRSEITFVGKGAKDYIKTREEGMSSKREIPMSFY